MKKIVFWGVFIQIFILIGLVSYAAMTKEPISEGNLSDLKGKWEGWRTLTRGDYRTELEIYNDTLPLKGKIIFHDVDRRGKMSGTNDVGFEQGKIRDNNFYLKWAGGKGEVDLSLYKDGGKMKLEGDCYLWGSRGTMSLKKK
ncbi:MAG: hypothetical protein KG012_11555 [Deltaproteobacteria bacterium]|nr:hypothetical protein [Deltaproteobacteria bacterium]